MGVVVVVGVVLAQDVEVVLAVDFVVLEVVLFVPVEKFWPILYSKKDHSRNAVEVLVVLEVVWLLDSVLSSRRQDSDTRMDAEIVGVVSAVVGVVSAAAAAAAAVVLPRRALGNTNNHTDPGRAAAEDIVPLVVSYRTLYFSKTLFWHQVHPTYASE